MSDEWKARYEEEYQIVARVWTAVKNGVGYRGEELSRIVADYVKRAEAAEAKLTSHPAPSGLNSLETAARALIAKLDAVHSNASWQGAMVTAYLHGHRYDGPTYSEELEALRNAVDALPPEHEVKEATDEEVNAAIDDLAEKAKRLYRGSSGHQRGVFAEIERKSEMLKRMLNTPADAKDALPPAPEVKDEQ
jgi:hypothetical protein